MFILPSNNFYCRFHLVTCIYVLQFQHYPHTKSEHYWNYFCPAWWLQNFHWKKHWGINLNFDIWGSSLERTFWFVRIANWGGRYTWPSPVQKCNLETGDDDRKGRRRRRRIWGVENAPQIQKRPRHKAETGAVKNWNTVQLVQKQSALQTANAILIISSRC